VAGSDQTALPKVAVFPLIVLLLRLQFATREDAASHGIFTRWQNYC
jgi:hypothetical protein